MKSCIKYYKMIFVFGFFFMSFEILQDFEEFDFIKLKSKGLLFEDISLPNETQIYSDSISFFPNLDYTKKSKLVKIKLSGKKKIIHNCYNFIINNDQTNEENIQIDGEKLNIYDLLKFNASKIVVNKDIQVVFNKGIYCFNINNENYILLGASNRLFIRNIERNYWILLNIKNNKVLNTYSFIDGYNVDANCFGDFNNDHKLDYLHWDFGKNKINFYTLKNKTFIEDKKFFIFVNPSQQKMQDKSKGVEFLYSVVDKSKSKWFYKL